MLNRSILAWAVFFAAGTACNAADRSFARTVPADARGEVEISNVAGKVTVAGWDRAAVEVTAKLGAGVERVDVKSDNGRTVIKVVLPSRSSRNGEAMLDVRVPKQSDVEISSVSADLDASGVLGAQRLKTVSGNIRAELAAASLESKTVSGDVKLSGRSQAADVRVTTVSGNVSLDRGAGDVDATTVSGDLRLELEPARSVRMHTTSGDLVFRGKLARSAVLEAETISGDVTLEAGAESGYEYEAASFSGDLDNCFGERVQNTSRHGPGTRLSGTVGPGQARVRVRSMSGDISLCNR